MAREMDVICDICKKKFGTAKITYPLRIQMSAFSTDFKHTCMECINKQKEVLML